MADTNNNPNPPAYHMVVDYGSDHGAVYKDGQRVLQGHPGDIQEQLLEMMGITIEGVSYERVKVEVPSTTKWPKYRWPETLEAATARD